MVASLRELDMTTSRWLDDSHMLSAWPHAEGVHTYRELEALFADLHPELPGAWAVVGADSIECLAQRVQRSVDAGGRSLQRSESLSQRDRGAA
jgi:hypothetical protein